jgi:hypothetical protein
MNYWQIGTFIFYVFSTLVIGCAVYQHFLPFEKRLNRSTYLGEVFLIGSTILYAEMMLLGMAGLYKTFFLWGTVVINALFVCDAKVRANFLKRIGNSNPQPPANDKR